MRRLILILAVSLAAALACGKDGGVSVPAGSIPGAPSPTPTPTGTSSTPPVVDAGPIAKPDAAAPLPIAKGDPCRGIALPLTQHYVPAGLCARIVASPPAVPALRQITFAPNGDLFGVTVTGRVML